MKKITSTQNPLVKHLSKLCNDRAYRKQSQTIVLESQKIILEAQKKYPFIQLLSLADQPLEGSDVLIDQATAQKIASLKSSDGAFAEIKRPENADLSSTQKLLILDQLQNPDNLGALCRSALAFGFDGLFIVEPSVDPYCPKSIRSSMGAVLHLPIRLGTIEDLKAHLDLNSYQVMVADAQGAPLSECKQSQPLALVLGNEAHGPDPFFKTFSKVSIPIQRVESLNVAIAGSLLMHELGDKQCQ